MHSLILRILIRQLLCILVPQQIGQSSLALRLASRAAVRRCHRTASRVLLLILLILRLLVLLDSGRHVLHASASHRGWRATVGTHGYPTLSAWPLRIIPGVLHSLLRHRLLHSHVVWAEGHAHCGCHLVSFAFGDLVVRIGIEKLGIIRNTYLIGRLPVHEAGPFALEGVPSADGGCLACDPGVAVLLGGVASASVTRRGLPIALH